MLRIEAIRLRVTVGGQLILRRVLFDEESFDEPAAITFEQFRRWANEADRNRQEMESFLDRLKGIFE